MFVIVSGIATYVAFTTVMDSLDTTLETCYEDRRFAEVFATVRRAPERVSERLREVPGVHQVQTRVVASVNLEVSASTSRCPGQIVSIPEGDQPALNQLFVREGRLVRPGREGEVLLNEVFAKAHDLGLSQDAVRITSGTHVLFDQWGGDEQLEGAVERVEPQSFTQVSSLGVEVQRVTVVADLTSPSGLLGAGYHVLARFVVWEGQDILQAPASALFRTDDGWAVFMVEDGRAVRRSVDVGRQTGASVQILPDLKQDSAVIARTGQRHRGGNTGGAERGMNALRVPRSLFHERKRD